MNKNKIIISAVASLLVIMLALGRTDVLQETKMDSKDPGIAAKAADDMLVRISEIEVYPEYLDEYLEYALTVGATSVHEEPGVIAIYPMIQQRDSCQIRILEIYASREAYRHHIGTEHFKTYKQGTLHMVKHLDLVDMYPMNPSAMPEIFRKMSPTSSCQYPE